MRVAQQAGIIGVGMSVPEMIVTNFDLEKIIDTTDEWIRQRSGIVERRRAAEGQAVSDFVIEASNRALAEAYTSPEEIDLIIVATVTGDYQTPATASIVQDGIGAVNAACFDLSAGCSGWIYALATADAFIQSGRYGKILIAGADLLSRITNWNDRSTCVLLGDGAGAAVVQAVPEGCGVLTTLLGSDGSGSDLLKVPAGGSRRPCTSHDLQSGQNKLRMSGSEVYKFATKIIPKTIETMLEDLSMTVDQIDLVIPHQANIRIIESAMKSLKLPMEKAFSNIDKYGNTSAATIPMALCEARAAGKIKKDDILALVGFGAGLTWGGAIVRSLY
ncbi:MAG: ketoacyl-ACP synthase III [Candidatus Berkelbacteria bacterium]|nr:ketoacyl-ACP synthase III [Candidatus Berkelbacteria bacterium]